MYLLKTLNFQLHVYSPFQALEGLKLQLTLSPEHIKEKVEPLIYRSYMSDALLLYSPGVVAAAALYLTNKEALRPLNLAPEQMKRVQDAAELVAAAREPHEGKLGEVRRKFKAFARQCPEFLEFMEQVRKYLRAGVTDCGRNERRNAEGKRGASEGTEETKEGPAGPAKKTKLEDVPKPMDDVATVGEAKVLPGLKGGNGNNNK